MVCVVMVSIFVFICNIVCVCMCVQCWTMGGVRGASDCDAVQKWTDPHTENNDDPGLFKTPFEKVHFYFAVLIASQREIEACLLGKLLERSKLFKNVNIFY